jgi:MFS family permease
MLGMAPASAGVWLGITYSSTAIIGVVSGGWLTDRWRQRDQCAAIWVAMISVTGAVPGLLVMATAGRSGTFVAGMALFGIASSMSGGATLALAQELVMPRMRGATISVFSLTITLLGAGLGPYWVGKISSVTGSLSVGLLSMEALTPAAIIVLCLGAQRLKHETESDRFNRAAAAGEVPETTGVLTRIM